MNAVTASSPVPDMAGLANRLRRESLIALHALRDGHERAKAWELLQERDEDGTARGPLPYTAAALEAWQKLRAAHPGDPSIVHHLAIAHHALAWDLELGDEPEEAAGEWETALACWQELAGERHFWSGLERTLGRCEAGADLDVIDRLRSNLIEEMLQVHVDFIRYHCELNRPERAAAHVGIVRRAAVKPALRKKLIHLVFEAMTASVAQAQAQNDYASGLVGVERFLGTFPDQMYLPALKMHAELCRDSVAHLSFRTQWDEIDSVSRRAEPVVDQLLEALKTERDPSAVHAMEELAFEMALRGMERVQSLQPRQNEEPKDSTLIEYIDAHEFPIAWGRKCAPASRTGARIRGLLAAALHSCAWALRTRSVNLYNNPNVGAMPGAGMVQAIQLCRQAVTKVEEAVQWEPDNTEIARSLAKFRAELVQIDILPNR